MSDLREISLDTETTGLEAEDDRIVEIGCVELKNHVATGRVHHVYINPKRPMSPEATAITGITDAMLIDKPVFSEIAEDFHRFIGEDPLVIHNAAFDTKFINAEFGRVGLPPLRDARVIDTLTMAKRRFPGAQSSLDALCRRFGVDNSAREKHGALLDAELLAEVYLELTGGRQPSFMLAKNGARANDDGRGAAANRPARQRAKPRRSLLSADEAAAHAAFIETLGENAPWREWSSS